MEIIQSNHYNNYYRKHNNHNNYRNYDFTVTITINLYLSFIAFIRDPITYGLSATLRSRNNPLYNSKRASDYVAPQPIYYL
jgi:hypothetical protein